MKNIHKILIAALLIFGCGSPDKKIVTRDEDQLVVGQSATVDNEAARVATGANTYYLILTRGDTLFVNDTNWQVYKPVIDTIPDENKPPVVNAGNDQTITLPVNSVTLSGFANDPEGEDITYKWVKLTGGGGTITNSTSATTTVTGLTAGSYSFRLGAIDEDGATGTDDVSVIVNPAPGTVAAIQGYGSGATGGAAGQTIRITNLSQLQSNIGSNRTILIDVSGTINSSIDITNISNLTIDAYSTKQDVTITNSSGDGLTIENSSNIIIRGLRSINNTGGGNSDGFNAVGSSSNVVFDHCSAYGNTDGNIDFSATGGKNFTAQWCILGNDKGSGNMLITTQNASVHHNLFIGDGGGEGNERNPFAHSRYSPVGSPTVDFRNNLVHASGSYASGTGWNATGNFVNNYYTSNKSGLINLCSDAGHCGSGYVAGNFNQANSVGGTRVNTEYSIPTQYRVTTTDATTAGKAVLASVGPYKRDSYELGVINSINIGGGNPTACTGYTYSAWSVCNNGTQTRDTTGRIPAGCTGNPSTSPVLTQPCGTTTGYTLVYSNGYDKTADLDPFDHGQIGNGSLSTTIFKTGPGSFKSVPANVSSGIRSEVQYGSGQTPLEGIVEYDVYYDNFFSNSGHSLQWHPSTSGGSGTGLFHKNGKMQFVTVKSGTTGTDVGASFTVSTKTWHHIKLTYKFGNSGYIKVELDGVEKVNQNVQMGDGSSPYLKVGVNMWVNQTSVVYYDNLKVYKK